MQQSDTHKIEMIGYNNAKAMTLYSTKKLKPFILGSLLLSFIVLIPALIFEIFELLFVFLIPVVLINSLLLNLVTANSSKLSAQQNVKYVFRLEQGKFTLNGKEVAPTECVKIYIYSDYLYLELNKVGYCVSDYDYECGSKEEFLAQVEFVKRHVAQFILPEISEEEITEILLKEFESENSQKIFLSPDKKRIVVIYSNDNGTFSVSREKMEIFSEEERLITKKYGAWTSFDPYASKSVYGTVAEALHDIETEIVGYTEILPSE